MGDLKYCPKCGISRECTKKGFNKAGKQLWICKTCGHKFPLITENQKVARTKKPIAKTAAKVKKVTEIIVNHNIIKTVSGSLTIDQAFDMVSSYFKEIAKEKVEIGEANGKKTIKFMIVSGSKS